MKSGGQRAGRASATAAKSRKAEALSKSRLRAWLQILKLCRAVEAVLRERMRTEFGATLPRFDVLAALDRADKGLRMSELSNALMVSNGNVTSIVDRLVDEGLIIRATVKNDRRASVVRLTQKGREVFSTRAAVHESWINELLSGLDRKDAKTVSTILREIRPVKGASR